MGRAVADVSAGCGRLRLAAWAVMLPTTVGAVSATVAASCLPGGSRPALALVTSLAEVDGAAVGDVGVVVVRGGVVFIVAPPLAAVAAVSGVCRRPSLPLSASLVADEPASSLRGRCGTCPA